MNLTDVRVYLPVDHGYASAALSAGVAIPDSFTWQGKPFIESGTRNQNTCGSCWAFSLATVLGDRYAIKYKLNAPPKPSVVWLISATNESDVTGGHVSCLGGSPQLAAKWIENNYLLSENCWPYSLLNTHPQNPPNNLMKLGVDCCFNCCGSSLAAEKFYIVKGSTKPLVVTDPSSNAVNVAATIALIQTEIMTNGPVSASFVVYGDFVKYWMNDAAQGKIYVADPSTGVQGGHAVALVGWGIENNVRYWIMRNSWGDTGDHGHCKMAMYTSISPSQATGIDVPIQSNGQWAGSALAFQANAVGEPVRSPSDNSSTSITSSWGTWILISAVILIAAVVYWFA